MDPFHTSSSHESLSVPVMEDSSKRAWLLPLNGWFERNGFSPLLMALLVLIVGFVGFQTIGAIVAIALVIAREGEAVLDDPLSFLEQQTDLLLVGNTVGQFLGLALPVLLIAALHSRPIFGFLRIRSVDFGLLLGSLVGLALLLPAVQWLGNLNAAIPLPEALAEFERQQMAFLESVLHGETGFLFTLFALAVTPAICEELFFRGYIQRQLERSAGVGIALIVTGVIFGAYHLRFSQIIPLSVLGIYLCYVTWRTGSIWPAVLLHVVNNGSALLISGLVDDHPEWGVDSVETLPAPVYIVIPSIILFALVIRALESRATKELAMEPLRHSAQKTI